MHTPMTDVESKLNQFEVFYCLWSTIDIVGLISIVYTIIGLLLITMAVLAFLKVSRIGKKRRREEKEPQGKCYDHLLSETSVGIWP
jgi:uncharacterized membrane protein